jgi:hypothetical protein
VFIGHFAVAFAAKPAVPRTSLATLIVAAQLLDLVWPVLVLVGVETVRIEAGTNPFLYLRFVHYPWSHSLLMAVAWGIGFALLYAARTRYSLGAIVVYALVVSHWVLDWISHRPDLQLAPGVGKRVGLGLWRSPAATLVVEAVMLAIGITLYVRARRSRDAAGTWGFWSFVSLLVAAYLASLFSGPPPGVAPVAATALVGYVLIPWIAWFDRHRGGVTTLPAPN